MEETPDHLETADETARVRQYWDELREEEREILDDAIHGGCSYSEIAERRGLPLGTVKSRARSGLHRLRESLRRATAEQGGTP